MENTEKTNRTTTAHCNTCLRETNHEVLTSHEAGPVQNDGEEYLTGGWFECFQTVRCCGCGLISFCHTDTPCLFTLDGECLGVDENEEPITARFPPAVRHHRPQWLRSVPQPIRGVLDEVYVALANDLKRLATMGLRAVIERVAIERGCDGKTFKDKRDAMRANGLVGERDSDFLDAVFDAGSAVLHRDYDPTTETVETMLSIVTHLLDGLYHLDDAGKRVRDQTPPRKKSE